jgi:hypothetical protein
VGLLGGITSAHVMLMEAFGAEQIHEKMSDAIIAAVVAEPAES